MKNVFQIAVLGCSSFARRSMIPALQSVADKFCLAAVGSRSPIKADQTASECAAHPYYSYSSLLNHPGLDAVYIPLPNGLHAEWVDRALDRGLHVLVEKSLACSAADVQALCQKAMRKNLTLVENFQFRHHRQFSQVRALLHAGEIGELRCIKASFGFPSPANADDIRYQVGLGGGALLDVGAYTIMVAQEYLGKDLTVAAALLQMDDAKGIDIRGAGLLKQISSDRFAQISFGFDLAYQCRVEWWGSRATLTANRFFTAPPNYAPELMIERDGQITPIPIEPDNHFINHLNHFYNLIAGHAALEPEYARNIRQAELIQAFRDTAHG